MRSESNRCRVSAVNASSAQVIAIIALALRILSLSSRDGHVPRCVPSQQLLCRILKLSTSGTLKLLYIYYEVPKSWFAHFVIIKRNRKHNKQQKQKQQTYHPLGVRCGVQPQSSSKVVHTVCGQASGSFAPYQSQASQVVLTSFNSRNRFQHHYHRRFISSQLFNCIRAARRHK